MHYVRYMNINKVIAPRVIAVVKGPLSCLGGHTLRQ